MQKFDRGNIGKGHPLAVNLHMENTIEINVSIIKFRNLPQHTKFFMLQKLPDVQYHIHIYLVCAHVKETIWVSYRREVPWDSLPTASSLTSPSPRKSPKVLY